jgi:hypothetical protein
MMPLPVRRKRRGMEKVENLCRTAREQNELINTTDQHVGTIHRYNLDHAGAMPAAPIAGFKPYARAGISPPADRNLAGN